METYDGDDLLLDQRREGDKFEKEGEVELFCANGLANMFFVSRGKGVCFCVRRRRGGRGRWSAGRESLLRFCLCRSVNESEEAKGAAGR